MFYPGWPDWQCIRVRSVIVGFVLGVSWLQNQATLPAISSYWLLLAFFSLLTLILLHRTKLPLNRSLALTISLLAAVGFIVGVMWSASFASLYLAQELPVEWEGRDVTVIGTIDSLPGHFAQGVRFNFKVERALEQDGVKPALPTQLALSWYSAWRDDEMQAVGDVQPGERWQLTVRLQRPHGNANPFGFDYEVWLLEQNLRATGYVRPDQLASLKNQRLDRFVAGFGNAINSGRAWLRERIIAALPGQKYAGVIVALVVGDQRAIPQSDWKVFNRTGIGHLISISGLHITMIAGLFGALTFRLWQRSFFTRMQLPLLIPAQKVAALAGLLAALTYVLLAGFGVPAQRTLYMLSVVAVALWSGRIASVSHVLSLAIGSVVVFDPWAVLWPGFWLSFGAVALILYASVGRTQYRIRQIAPGQKPFNRFRWWSTIRSAIGNGTQTQYVVTLGLAPLSALLFGQISLISPLANAVAIPLVSFVVTPLALMGSVLPDPISTWLLGFSHQVVDWLAQIMGWLSDSPLAVWSAPVPAGWIFAFAMAGTLWMLAPRGWPVRWIGLTGWIPLWVNVPAHPGPGEFWVLAFDVGQGMALLIETEHRRLLYDTGPTYSPDSDGGNRVIAPYLKARGIDALDGVVISHNDNDHSGGALSIFEAAKIGWVASSLSPDNPIVRRAPNHRHCVAGQQWDWDGVRFEILHPAGSSYGSQKWKPNARSCTLKVSVGALSLLLPGDIEAVQETELLGRAAQQLHANVLLAPHHGSGTSSTLAFLQNVQPQIAIFQVGYRNRYHHPKPLVFERYRELGIKRLRNDEAGAITVEFGATLNVREYRSEHARYWHGR